jgi:2-haloacid dehalogenase
MTITLAIDVYGTLINTDSVAITLRKHIGDKAAQFSRTWREKQLEYTFRRGLMRHYESFDTCIKNALDYTSSYFKVALYQKAKNELINAYNNLPTFHDVESSLAILNSTGFRIFALSNGSANTVELLLNNANIRSYFLDIVSVDEIKSYKPNPDVYSHFLTRAEALIENAWLISSNPFDVIGAVSYGMRAAWIKRSAEALFDPWGIEPTLTLNGISNLAEQINQLCKLPNLSP